MMRGGGGNGPYSQYDIPPGQPWALSTSPITGYTLANILTGEVMTFDAQGRLQATTDAYGNSNTLTAGTNQPTSLSNSGGRSLAVSYGGNGLLADAQSPLWQARGASQAGSQHVAYGYNPQGQLTSLTRGAGTTDALTETFGYSGAELVTVTTPYTQSQHTWQLGYDPQGRVTGVTSPSQGQQGQAGYTPAYTTQFTYGVSQTVVVEGFGSGQPLTHTYTLDAQGNATQQIDGMGDTSSTTYDTDHDALMSTDANGNTTSNYYQYVGPTGSTGLITETDTPPVSLFLPSNVAQPWSTYHHYNAGNDLIETDLPAGGIERYGYDGRHGVITSTVLSQYAGCPQANVARASSASIVPNGLPQCSYIWHGTITQRDSYGEATSVTNGNGVDMTPDSTGTATLDPTTAVSYTQANTYSPQGDLLSESTPPITTTPPSGQVQANTPVTTTYGYDLDGNRTTIASANGAASGNAAAYTTVHGYDHLGRQVTTTLPPVMLYDGSSATPTERTTYDGDGNVAQSVDGDGDITLNSYDPLGREVSTTDPVSGTTVMTRSATELAATQDPQGNVTTYRYDGAGRQVQVTAPVSGTTQYQYDPQGNSVAITTADATSGAPVQIERESYDALGRVVTDTIGGPATAPVTTTTGYDADGNVAEVVHPNQDATVNTYYLNDQLETVESNTGPVQAPTKRTYESYVYDQADNVRQYEDFDQRVTYNTYDGDNRLTQSAAITADLTTGASSAVTTTTGYDPDGNTVRQIEQTQLGAGPAQTHTHDATYNAADWQASTTDDGLTTAYGYDGAGQERTETVLNGNAPVTTALDPAGRATAIGENADGTGPYTSTFGYNRDDLPLTATLPGGIAESGAYDPDSRLTTLTMAGPATGSDATTLASVYGYGYDAANRTVAETSTVNGALTSTQLSYDGQSRLTGWSGQAHGPESWGYDGNGNIISNTEFISGTYRTTVYTYTPSLPNEIQRQQTAGLGVESFAYDRNGDTTSLTSTDPATYPNGQVDPYHVDIRLSYDAQARPLTVTTLLDGAPLTVTLGYNADGERASYTAITGTGRTLYSDRLQYRNGLVAQDSVISATAGGATVSYTDTFIYGTAGEPLELLRQQGGATTRYWYELDGNGSVVALTDSQGRVVDRYAYDPWGEGLPEGTNAPVRQPLRYDGYWWDQELGWYWVGVREYEPEGRWLQPDPSQLDGVRTYAYVGDDPVDTSDPSGLIGVAGGTDPCFIDRTDPGASYYAWRCRQQGGHVRWAPTWQQREEARTVLLSGQAV